MVMVSQVYTYVKTNQLNCIDYICPVFVYCLNRAVKKKRVCCKGRKEMDNSSERNGVK